LCKIEISKNHIYSWARAGKEELHYGKSIRSELKYVSLDYSVTFLKKDSERKREKNVGLKKTNDVISPS